MKTDETFKTADLSLVAYLSYLGFGFETELEEIKGSGFMEKRVVFCFNGKEECIRVMREFYANRAAVEPQRYYHIIRTLKSLIREKLGLSKEAR